MSLSSRSARAACAGVATLLLCVGLACATFARGQTGVLSDPGAPDWSGTWHTWWPDGQALLTLRQDGEAVTGTYRPGNGRVSGSLEGPILHGTWAQAGAEGRFTFALAPDGQSFSGRFDGNDYWNGRRLQAGAIFEPPYGSKTPAAALASALSAINAAAAGDSAAELTLRRFLTFPDNESNLSAANARIAGLSALLQRVTVDLSAVPAAEQDTSLTVRLGPAGLDWTFPLTLRRSLTDLWDLEVPDTATLAAWQGGLLAAADVPDLDAFDHARRASPRAALRTFLHATDRWASGGRAVAFETLDLSAIPEHLRTADGTFAAEYLRAILHRIGAPIWQEIPDNPGRRSPFEVYENAGGRLVLARFEVDEGPVWRFDAGTLAAAPEVFAALQNLPPAHGAAAAEPLTRAFRLRATLGRVSPALLERPVLLENWQWLALGLALPASLGLSWLVAGAVRRATDAGLATAGAGAETRAAARAACGWPLRWVLTGCVVWAVVRDLALRQDASAVAGTLAGLVSVSGATVFAYFVVDAIAGALQRGAAKTSSNIDDIATAIGGGVARVAVLVGGAVLAAEILGLPYEGVIAALGVGGLALGFAARDAVSNFISAGILMADRPFRKGDLIEANGQVGVVEAVGLRSTRLRTLDDALLIVPNAKVSDEQVNNWGRLRNRRINLVFWVDLDTDQAALERFARAVAAAFDSLPEAVGRAIVARDSLDTVGVAVRVLGYVDARELHAFMAVKDRFVGHIVTLARSHDVVLARAEDPVSAAEIAPPSVETRAGAVPG